MRHTTSAKPSSPVSDSGFLSVSQFLDSAPGRLLLEWEKNVFQTLTADVFGTTALQIGMPELHTLSANRIRSQWLLEAPTELPSVPPPPQLGRIAGLPEFLPIADESLDLITLPHALDFSACPQQALREAVRVLEPEGRIVLTGFNPLSHWWLRQQAVCLGARPYLPSRMNPVPLTRLKDWFSLLGLEIDRGIFGLYRPAFRSEKRLRTWQWIDKAGDRWMPHLSNLIALSAVKRLTRPQVVNCNTFPTFKRSLATGSSVPAASVSSATTTPSPTQTHQRNPS